MSMSLLKMPAAKPYGVSLDRFTTCQHASGWQTTNNAQHWGDSKRVESGCRGEGMKHAGCTLQSAIASKQGCLHDSCTAGSWQAVEQSAAHRLLLLHNVAPSLPFPPSACSIVPFFNRPRSDAHLGEAVKLGDALHRPENLLAADSHAVLHVGKNGWLNKVAL